jgi:Undecaprenyl-phosphate glucose phosphotransferase
MLKRYQHIVGGTFRLVDACVIVVAWLLSYGLRFYTPLFEITKGFPDFEKYASLSPLVLVLWMMVFSSMGVYRSRRMLRRTHEAQLLVKSHLVAMLIFIAVTYLFSEYKYSRGVILYFGFLGGTALVFFRLMLRNTLRNIRRRGFNLRHVLAVGEGPAIETVIQRLDKFPELGIRVVGAVIHEDSKAIDVHGKPVLGRFKEIASLVRKTKADQVLIALPRQQYGDLDRILLELRDETIDLQLVPDIHEYVTLGCEIEDFEGFPIVNLNDSPLDGWGALAKRWTDIFVSAIALLLLSPFLILISAIVRISSPGPVLYRQVRMGLDGNTFDMLKFRTMRFDPENKPGWTVENDPRRTAIGSFLRATSVDELPQLWNVFRGDMSLVGPRPEQPTFVEKFRQDIPHYMLRHKVKAGITGWAQINGWRGNTSLANRIECDLYYIRNWSYVLDWKIMLMTIWRGFINRNAY